MASKAQKLVGKEMYQKDYGRVRIDAALGRSNVKFTVLQRKPGWYEPGEYYKPVRSVHLNPDGTRTIYWYTYKRDEYGTVDQCHINDLLPLT